MVMVVMVEELVEVAEICQVVLLPQVMVLVQEEMSHIREENVGVEALVGTVVQEVHQKTMLEAEALVMCIHQVLLLIIHQDAS